MNTGHPTTALLLSFALLSACSADDQTQPDPSLHASENVVPGSYEDWCAEHEVPETQCTRCDPSLVAAFKATNDWCAEHGVPESLCRPCNPDIVIARPPKPEGR